MACNLLIQCLQMLASDYRMLVLNIWLPVIQPGTIKGVIVPGVHYINEYKI
jgi:hypothetical protein